VKRKSEGMEEEKQPWYPMKIDPEGMEGET
jgi:hypothetical protein